MLRLDLVLSDQSIAAHFFVSHLILVFAWALSGPMVAAVLSLAAAASAVYVGLGAKEPAFFLQVGLYSALFLFMAYYLQSTQSISRDRVIAKERIAEDLNLAEKDIVRKENLKDALQKKITHFLDLQRFAEELRSLSEPEEIARKIVSEAREVLAQADQCVLYLVDGERQELSLLAADPMPEKSPREAGGRVFDHWVMRRSQSVMVENTRDDFRFISESKPDLDDWRSVCASPLTTENKVLGVIRANSGRVDSFTADDLRLLDIFASFGAVALRNALLYRRMGDLATRDSLTGLYVNRYFQERLSHEVRRGAASEDHVFSLILLDIDHFKRYNDEYGHSAGDMVLKTIGSLAEKAVGSSGTVARYGGEEFVVLLPGIGRKEAKALAEELRKEIEETPFVLRRVHKQVTASFGVASWPAAGRSKEELIQAADRKLYEAKRGGRNRVCAAG